MGNLTHDTLCKGVELQFSGPGLSMVEPLAMNSTERKKILTVLLSLLRCINWFHENRNQSESNLAKDYISPRGRGKCHQFSPRNLQLNATIVGHELMQTMLVFQNDFALCTRSDDMCNSLHLIRYCKW